MANRHRTADICQQMEQLKSANNELTDQVATLTNENYHLRHQQETVQMQVYSRLQETGESLRHQVIMEFNTTGGLSKPHLRC